MEIDSLKSQLGNLLALHRDDDANADDVVFATVDYMKKAHEVAQMLLLEGRFQELQRCLHLCQAAFGNTSNVRASLVGRSGSYAPLLSFVGASPESPDAEEAACGTTVSPTVSADGEGTTTAEGNASADALHHSRPHHHTQQPLFELYSDEDRRVFAALQGRTAQLQKQLEAAMRVRRGRDTEYYMQRLGLREKGAAPPADSKNVSVRVHVQQLPAFNQSLHGDFLAHSAVTQPPLRLQPPARRDSILPPLQADPLPTVALAVHRKPWMPDGTDAAPPAPPERGVSFGNQMHFSPGKGRLELPPLVTSGRLFGVAYDNPMSVQHTVFGSSVAPAAGDSMPRRSTQAQGTKNGGDGADDNDFGIGAVASVFGAEVDVNAVPLHLQPVPPKVRLWSSSSSSSTDAAASSNAFASTANSMQVERAASPPEPELEAEAEPIFDDPLVSDMRSTITDDDAGYENEEEAEFTSPRRGRGSSLFRSTRRSSVLSSSIRSVSSTFRRATATGPLADSGNDSVLSHITLQRRRTTPEVTATPPNAKVGATMITAHARPPPPSWRPLTGNRRRSGDAYGMSNTNSTFTASMSRTLVSMAESGYTANTSTTSSATTTTGTSASDRQLPLPGAQILTPAAAKAAKAVEAARQTTQYVFSSIKAQHTRSGRALERCEALSISRLPYTARQAALAARTLQRRDEAAGDKLQQQRGGSQMLSSLQAEDWSPSSQVLAVSAPSSHVFSSAPASPNTGAILASPFLSAVGMSATQFPQMTPPALHNALSPAAAQQIREVCATYEQHMSNAANDVRGMEARWVSQHRQLQTQSSLPPLENIAEWRKRRGRWQQNAERRESGGGGGTGRQHGHSRHRSRGPPPVPPPVARVSVTSSPITSAALTHASIKGHEAILLVPSIAPQGISRSPSFASTTATRESRRSSYNAEEGSGPSSRSSSDAAPRPSLDVVRVDDGDAVQHLATPIDRRALPFVGLLPGERLASLTQTPRVAQGNSAKGLAGLPSAPQRSPQRTESPDESSATVASGAAAEAVVEGVSKSTKRPFVVAAGLNPEDSSDGSSAEGREETSRAANGAQLPDAPAESGFSESRDDDAERCAGEGARQQPVPYTYHPAVEAIITERQRRAETSTDPRKTLHLHPPSAEETLETWRRTLRVVAGDARANSAVEGEAAWSSHAVCRKSSYDALDSTVDAPSFASLSHRPDPARRANTEVFASPSSSLRQFLQLHQQPRRISVLEANPLHRHGIRCGAAEIRSRHTQEVLSAAIRNASAHMRAEDLVVPKWKQGGSASVPSLTAQTQRAQQQQQQQPPSPPPLAALQRAQGRSLFPFHFPDVFSAGAAMVPGARAGARVSMTAEATSEGGSVQTLRNARLRRRSTATAAGGAAPDKTPDLSLMSMVSATTASTPATLSLTAKVPTLQAAAPPPASLIGTPSTTSLPVRESGLSKDSKSAVSSSLDGSPPPPSLSASSARDAYQHLHAAFRVGEALRAAPNWALVPPSTLGRCLPLCMSTVRLQRWWRQWLACRELQQRQRRTSAVVWRQQECDAAALRIQRQLRVYWARKVVSRYQAACAAATEQRVAAESTTISAPARANTSNSTVGHMVTVDGFGGTSAVWAASSTSSRQSHRASHRLVSGIAPSDDRSRASVGEVLPTTLTTSPTRSAGRSGGGVRRVSSQLSAALTNASLLISSTGATSLTGRRTSAAPILSLTDDPFTDDTVQHDLHGPKSPWEVSARKSVSHNDFALNHSYAGSASSYIAAFAQPKSRGSAAGAEVPRAPSAVEAAPSRPLSFSSTFKDGEGSLARASRNTSVTENTTRRPQQQPALARHSAKDSATTSAEQQDPARAARRIQRWYRRRSAEETAMLCHEVAVLTAVVTGRAPLDAIHDALRPPIPQKLRQGSSEDNSNYEEEAEDEEDESNASEPLTTNTERDDETADTEAMRELLAKCTGDVYQAYLKRAAAARRGGDYMTPLERVSLRALQRSRQEREDEVKQQRLVQERQQRLRLEQQQRRERQVVDAAKLLQRVGRGLRWRRWLRDRQCKDAQYRATHTLDLLSQTDALGARGVRLDRVQRGASYSRGGWGSMSTSAEAQQVYLAGGPKVTAHVMARLRSTHPEWFGLDVDQQSAAWIVRNASTEQLAAIVTVQSCLSAFASCSVTFGQYQHACARCIQLAWRLYCKRRRRNHTRKADDTRRTLCTVA